MNKEGWTTGELAKVLNAELYGSSDIHIHQVLTDSRRLSFPTDTVFFALRSFKNDGHRYIPELFAKGVRVFVVDNIPQVHRSEAVFLLVKDTMDALHDAASAWRSAFHFAVLGITGSNGKTVVKEWVHQLLHHQFRIVRSPRSYNSQVGVPLSLFHMRSGHELGIFEAGISQIGEMEKLEKLIRPTWGIFTNLGDAHQEHFANKEIKLQEKLKLFEHAEHLIYCSDVEMVRNAILHKFQDAKVQLLSWGHQKEHSDIWIEKQRTKGAGTKLKVHWKSKALDVHLPFTDDASLENAMHALAFSLAFGVGPKVLLDGVKRLSSIAMRLELKKARNDSAVINDSYNSDPQSIRIALDFTGQQAQYSKKVVILSDLEQSGVDDAELYPMLAEMLEHRKIDLLIGIGDRISEFRSSFQIPAHFYPSTSAFVAELPLFDLGDSIILLKGARRFAFETIAHYLEERVHQTVLEINLSAVAHNLNYFRKLIRPETKIMAMVKAFGYGAGNYELANVLEYHNIDFLAVAYADEGVALRQAGITARIMVMNPSEESYEQILEYKLEPEIYSLSELYSFHRSVQHYSGEMQDLAVPVHVKVDTGMRRLGFEPEQMERVADEILAMPGIRVASVFSHLAASDDPSESAFTEAQISTFRDAAARLESGLGYVVIKHILNSSGIHNYPEAQFDMVRLGIGLYGISSVSWERHHLKRVSRLITRISQIKSISPGESVGYGRSFKAERSMKSATLPIGYADGIDRRLSNGAGEVWLNGQRAPIIGKVCMDMIMVDVTTIDCQEGDEVEIFGDHISIYEYAERTGTIPYEVLTSVSSRVKRIYFQE